jgi:arsenate reductase
MKEYKHVADSPCTSKHAVLFLCTHNSVRSQMAEGWLRHLYGVRFDVFSAGIYTTRVHPLAIRVMAEIGIDITRQTSSSLAVFLERSMDVVVTVCDRAKETCPFFPSARFIYHRSFPDPSMVEGSEVARLQAFRDVRDT